MAEGFRIATAYVVISPDADDFAEQLEAKVEEATAGVEAKVRATLDQAELDEGLDDAKAKVDELDGKTATATLGADSADLDEKTDEAKAKVDEVDGKTATAILTADDSDLDEVADDAKAKVEQVSGTRGTAKLDADSAAAKAKIDDLNLQIARLKLQASTGIRLPLDTSADEVKIATLEAQIRALQDQEDESSGGGLMGMLGGAEMPGGLMGGLAVSLAALSPGLAGATTGLGLLGGTGFLAFDGIAKALSAANQSAQNVGMTGAQVAEQQFSNSVANQQATEAVGQAQAQAAMTQRDAAASQVQALEQVQQAQQNVSESDYNLTEAQYNLSQSYVQARENIVQLNDALADQKLNVQAAQLAVSQAEYNQLQVDQNAYSTDLDRQQAALAVAQAKQQVKDATDQESDAQVAANLANSQGVSGSQTVIQAKQAVTQAQYAQSNAVQAYADAQANLTRTELDNATQIQQSQEAVAQAQQNVTNTIKEQQLEWAAEQSASNSAANQFALDMAKLTPAGQGFVNAVLGLMPAYKGLEAVAQNTVLPGMTVWLDGIKGLLPIVSKGVGEMGSAMSQAFGAFGKQMQTPAFAKTLQGLISNGIQFANIVLPAFAGFIQELAISGGKKGAVDALAFALAGIANGLTGIVKGITPFQGAINTVFGVLGKAVASLGGPIGQVIGSFATAIAPALQALLPGFETLVDALGNGLSQALIGTAPLLLPLARAITIVVEAVAPFLPQIGTLIGKLGTELAPVLVALLPLVSQLAQLFTQQGTQAMLALAGAVEQLLPQITQLLITATPLIDLAVGLGVKFLTLTTTLVTQVAPPIIGALTDIVKAINNLGHYWDLAVHDVQTWALWLWHNVFDPMWQGIESGATWLVGALSTAWGKIEGVFKTPVNFLISTVYDKGIARFWNDIVGAVGLSALKLPIISPLAKGGVIPGYAPGHDTVPAMLSPGEAVLTPGATKAIGPDTVHALNAAHPPSGGGGGMLGKEAEKQVRKHLVERPLQHAVTLGKFASGGIVGDIGSFFSGAMDIGKAVAALATGNTTAFDNSLAPFIGTTAAGNLGKIMVALPKAVMGDAAKAVMNLFSGPGGVGTLYGSGGGRGGALTGSAYGAGGGVTSQVQSWFTQAAKLTGAPASWIPPLETIGRYESGYNATAVNNTPAGIAAGTPEGVMQTIMSTFLSYHQPGTSMSIFDPIANIASAIRYIRAVYGNPDDTPGLLAVAQGKTYTGYDSGGWLQPGSTIPINQTGQPEAVLTPQESAAFIAMVQRMTAQPGGVPGSGQVANLYFTGPQMPGPEQLAEMYRQLALAMGG